MTERVDLDRLADFVGGALDGTPDDAAVRALIDTDPGWAAAHADLVAATAAVNADLRAVGSRPNAVPGDVAVRLDAVLRQIESEAASGSRAGEPDAAPTSRVESAPGGRPDTRRPGATASGPRGTDARGTRGADARGPGGPRDTDARGTRGADARGPGGPRDTDARGTRGADARGPGGPRGTGPGRRAQSRRAKWAAAVSAAAAVIAFGVGFVALVPGTRSSDDSASTAPNADAGGAAAPEFAGGPTPFANGRDYQPGSFAGLGSEQHAAEAPPAADLHQSAQPGQVYSGRNDAKATIAPELARLTVAVARQACLDAIQQVHGGVPSVVEFARYTGKPALIVRLEGSRSGDGKPFVVVAGPDCGLVAGDVDELHSETLA